MPTVALVLAVFGLLGCWVPIYGWAAVVAALFGSGLGLAATFRPNRTGLAVASLAIGLLALALGLAVQVPIAMALASAGSG